MKLTAFILLVQADLPSGIKSLWGELAGHFLVIEQFSRTVRISGLSQNCAVWLEPTVKWFSQHEGTVASTHCHLDFSDHRRITH